MSWTLSELNAILAGAGDWPWIPAYLEYCNRHNILKKKKILHLTPAWAGWLCFLGKFQSFGCCLHASLESILPEQQQVAHGAGRSLCLQNRSAPCQTALKLFSIHVGPKRTVLYLNNYKVNSITMHLFQWPTIPINEKWHLI